MDWSAVDKISIVNKQVSPVVNARFTALQPYPTTQYSALILSLQFPSSIKRHSFGLIILFWTSDIFLTYVKGEFIGKSVLFDLPQLSPFSFVDLSHTIRWFRVFVQKEKLWRERKA